MCQSDGQQDRASDPIEDRKRSLNKKLSCRRHRTMLHVIEYFAKSLKINYVIQNDTLE